MLQQQKYIEMPKHSNTAAAEIYKTALAVIQQQQKYIDLL